MIFEQLSQLSGKLLLVAKMWQAPANYLSQLTSSFFLRLSCLSKKKNIRLPVIILDFSH
jgi:hypothetical protein